ncbi:DeoR/GlpR family transcriptional regulator [Pelagibius sp.]|uniref:DeoR/GlpR family transcriptional regulator n=1 Tax=Pelagibius sp. TaxID=1931238 RepID=UPI003B5146AC
MNQRQERIIDLVRERGFVAIEALADHFAVTPQTVRRDINQLCDQGLMRRYHGGAGLPSSVENLAYQTRQVMNREAKARIAAIAAAEVPDNASLFINIGTTTEEVAKALVNRRGLRIITNNLNVASILSENRDFEVIIAGGLVRSRDKGIVGEATLDAIRQFKVDIGIIGISGIDDDGSLLDFDYREVRAAQAIIGNSRRVFLVTDHTKFGRNAMVRLGHLDEIDAVFTDRPPSKAMREILKQADVALHIAAGAEEAPASAPVGPAAP